MSKSMASKRLKPYIYLPSAAVLAIAITFTGGQYRGLAQAVDVLAIDIKPLAKGYRASGLMGATVTNDKNERVGTIDDLIIDRERAIFAVLQVGGFLGLGGRLVAVPYQSLNIDDAGKKIVLPGASKEQLQKLTEFHYTS
jgi:sporulation protein YlmC with PRC-barrel domain